MQQERKLLLFFFLAPSCTRRFLCRHCRGVGRTPDALQAPCPHVSHRRPKGGKQGAQRMPGLSLFCATVASALLPGQRRLPFLTSPYRHTTRTRLGDRCGSWTLPLSRPMSCPRGRAPCGARSTFATRAPLPASARCEGLAPQSASQLPRHSHSHRRSHRRSHSIHARCRPGCGRGLPPGELRHVRRSAAEQSKGAGD